MTKPKLLPEPEEFIREVLEVNLDDLVNELLRVPQDLIRFSQDHYDYYEEWQMRKHEASALYAALVNDPDVALELHDKLGKKPTVDQLKAAVLLDDGYMKAKEAEFNAEVRVKRSQGFLDALKEKARALQMATALTRDELEATGRFDR